MARLGATCPGQSSFYVCTNKPTRFVGCCAVDPCNTANGYCPDDKVIVSRPSDSAYMAQSRLQIRADEGGLSNVAVAGIAVASTVVGGALVCAIIWYFWKKRYQNSGRTSALPATSYEPYSVFGLTTSKNKVGSKVKQNSRSFKSFFTKKTQSSDATHKPIPMDQTYKYDSLQHVHLASGQSEPSPELSEFSYGSPSGGNPLAYSTTDLSGTEYYGAMPPPDPLEDEEAKARRAELAHSRSTTAGRNSVPDGSIAGFTRTYSADMSRAYSAEMKRTSLQPPQQPAVGEMVG